MPTSDRPQASDDPRASDVDSINHVGIVVRSMAAAADRYEQLGFMLTPYSVHAGAWKPGEPVAPLRSGNRCVMFRHDYLEILASEDPSQPSPRLEGYLRHHQGGHIICFGSDELQRSERRCAERGVATSGIIPLQRDVDTPDGVRTARFERMQFSPSDSPEGYIQVARHLTPEYIYQDRYVRHPNGCTGLSAAVLVVDDVPAFTRRYAAYTGVDAVEEDGLPIFRFSLCSRLVLMDPRQASNRLPGTLYPPLPGIAAVEFRCPDLAAQARRLQRHRIPFQQASGRELIVPAEEACGIAVLFAGAG